MTSFSLRSTDLRAGPLFHAVRARDDAALADFVQRLTPWLAAEVRRAGARGGEVDEVVQDTWIAAIAAADAMPDELRLLPWLAAVAGNRLVSLRRSQRRRARLHALGAAENAAVRSPDVVALVRGREALLAVRAAVDGLPAPYRDVLRLHLFEGLSPHEIAQRLGLGRVGVRVRLYRGMRRLRRVLPEALALLLLAALSRRGTSQAPLWLGIAAAGTLVGAWQLAPAVDAALPVATTAHPAATATTLAADLAATTPREPAPQPAADATGSVTVQVEDGDGVPLPGVGVLLAPADGSDPLLGERRAATDHRGVATFHALGAERLQVRCDRGPATWLEAGAARRAVLRVAGGRTLRGRVADLAGHALAGARIWLAGPDRLRRDGIEVARTADDGSFCLRGIAAGSALAVRADGFAGTCLRTVDGGDLGTIVLAARGGAAAIEVLAADGRPCADATVILGCSEHGALPNGEWPAAMPPLLARTDADGRWAVRGLEPGFLPLVVRAAGMAPSCTMVAITPDVETAVQVRLQPGASLRGRVVAVDGRAVAGARIACRSDATFAGVDARSAADGSFHFAALATGDVGLLVWAADGHAVERVLTLGPEGADVEVELPAEARRRGRLLDESGAPLAGWLVSLPWLAARSADGDPPDVVADADGRVVCTAGSGADWSRLLIRPPQSIYWACVGSLCRDLPDGTFELRLPAAMQACGHVRGRIVSATGAPVAAATLASYDANGQRSVFGATDADGCFACGPLPVGDYDWMVEAPRADVAAVHLPPFTLGDGEVHRLDVVAPAAGRLAWRIAFDDGGVPRAPNVTVRTKSGRLHAIGRGAQAEQALAAGEYTVATLGDDFVWTTVPCTVRAGEVTELVIPVVRAAKREFSLRHLPIADAGGQLSGRFFDAVSGATLYSFRVPMDKAFPLPLTSFLPIGAIGCEATTANGQLLRATVTVSDLRPSFEVTELPFRRID